MTTRPIVYLREVDAGTPNACWLVCAKGDPGAVAFAPYPGVPLSATERGTYVDGNYLGRDYGPHGITLSTNQHSCLCGAGTACRQAGLHDRP